jgi:hypothetical protein
MSSRDYTISATFLGDKKMRTNKGPLVHAIRFGTGVFAWQGDIEELEAVKAKRHDTLKLHKQVDSLAQSYGLPKKPGQCYGIDLDSWEFLDMIPPTIPDPFDGI